jgi:glycosyltransferase involved in cell wall biosynthesis
MALVLEPRRLRSRSGVETTPLSSGLAMIGSYPPRACGIATFTRDLRRAVQAHWLGEVSVLALDRGTAVDPARYPQEVTLRIKPGKSCGPEIDETLTSGDVGIVSLQHEFGLFGGSAGDDVTGIVMATRRPVVTTLHTVPIDPEPDQERVIRQLARSSVRLVVMSRRGQRLLVERYGIDPSVVRVIPHGVPDVPFMPTATPKAALGIPDDMLILSYGLISPNKGLELAIAGLAETLPSVPRARLVIAGATHPEIVRRHGEAYRRSLQQLACDLGVAHRLTFIDRYLTDEDVRAWLLAADVFVTPYVDSAQVTSGTLAYAMASGRAVVSTPYEHALELLADGRGRIVPFGDPRALGAVLVELLSDAPARERIRRAAWDYGRGTVWSAVGMAYADLFMEVLTSRSGA